MSTGILSQQSFEAVRDAVRIPAAQGRYLVNMNQLSPEQRELVSSLSRRLGVIAGIRAVVLGGSHARGRAQPRSDIDLYIFSSEAAPFSIERIRELAEAVNDTPRPVVTDFYGWGP